MIKARLVTIRVCCLSIVLILTSLYAYGSDLTLKKDTTVGPVLTVQQIVISGNKITKARVILNELAFVQGEKIAQNDIANAVTLSRHNLLNTSLFNYVTVRYTLQSDHSVIFHVSVEERWYWWVFPIFEVADRNLSAFLNSGDWSRVNYGIYLKRNNFRGRNEHVAMRLRFGYTTQVYFSYASPEFNKSGGWGCKFDFRMYDQLAYKTEYNQQLFKQLQEEKSQITYEGSVYYSLRKNLFYRHKMELRYMQYNVNDSIIDLNPDYLHEGKNRLQYLELKYNFDADKRDSKVYPLDGSRLKLEVSHSGFGVWQDDLVNFRVGAQYDKHIELHDKWHFMSSVNGVYNTSNQLPYVLKEGIGYKNFINGYELYVMDGTKQGMMKNQLLFTLLKPRVKNIGFMPLTQFKKVNYAFYLKGYYDFGYVWNDNPGLSNTFVNDWQYGYGLGLDFVTFYDMVWSLNYSINRQKNHGFFVHFNLAI